MGRKDITQGWRKAARIAALCLCSWIAAGAVATAQNDTILLKNGKEREARIKSEDFDGVRYTQPGSGSTTLIPWAEIDSIEYGGGRDYDQAMGAFAAGRWAEALGQFEALLADGDARQILRQGALYHAALAHLRVGKPDEATAKYELLLKEFPMSRYLVDVGTNLLAIHMAKDDVASAARALEPVLAAGKAQGANETLVAGLGVLRGRLLEEQGQLDEADKAYAAASKAEKVDPGTVLAAKLGLGRCAQKRGRAADAEKIFRELTVADAPNSILAGAWNGLGDLAFQEAASKRDQEGLRLALLYYLRGVVLYVPAQGEVSEDYDRSLAGASKAFKAIGELETNAERKQLFLERARQRRDQLAAQSPGSRLLRGL